MGYKTPPGIRRPPHRPKKVFDREEVIRLRHQGRSYRQIAQSLGLGLGTVVQTLEGHATLENPLLQ